VGLQADGAQDLEAETAAGAAGRGLERELEQEPEQGKGLDLGAAERDLVAAALVRDLDLDRAVAREPESEAAERDLEQARARVLEGVWEPVLVREWAQAEAAGAATELAADLAIQRMKKFTRSCMP
jgi:hypothetical protein